MPEDAPAQGALSGASHALPVGGVDLPREQQDSNWARSHYEGLSARIVTDSRRTLPFAGESMKDKQWTHEELGSESRGEGPSRPSARLSQTSALDDQQSPLWTSRTARSAGSSGSNAQWRSEGLVHEGLQYGSHRSTREEARLPDINRFQHEGIVDNDPYAQLRPHSDPRPRTSYEFHEPLHWYDNDSTRRTRSHGGRTQHHPAPLPQPASYDRMSRFPGNAAYDMRTGAPPLMDLAPAQGARLTDLERRRDQVGGQLPAALARQKLRISLLQIAATTRELLYNLEGPQETRRERLWKVQRATHQIMGQIQDLATSVNIPLPPRVSSNAGPSFPPSARPVSSGHGLNDIIARLQKSNPQAAEQAARDMAAIRARTHGNAQKAPGTDKGKERESGGDKEG